jgi:diguanylate cyclase (GGDEF)-like protein
MILESAGYQVRLCHDPRLMEEDLSAFQPDLVLMDIILPHISGYDLARYIRQNEHYATLPIVFLSTQNQLQVTLATIKAGGDDHLVKPVNPALLLSTIAARVERARFLQSLVERDGLTRLLTHTAFLERAKIAISQRTRKKDSFTALVMIDLDHFKSINDRYGHPVGDRVIASLSALLRRRLRQSDTIGRYGGEEFVVLLEDLNRDEAIRLVNRLREEFAQFEQNANNGETFKVTFSAGVAILTAEMNLEQWKETADQALYAAKSAGRNQVKGN